MSNYLSPINLKFLKELGQAEPIKMAPIPFSPGYIRPGNVLSLNYQDWEEGGPNKIVLIVSNKKGNGIFINSSGHLAMSCLKLHHMDIQTASIILKAVAHNKAGAIKSKISNYTLLTEALGIFSGELEYRTYLATRISNIQRIYIDKNNLP